MFFLYTRSPLLRRFAVLMALLAMLVPVATNFVHHPAATQTFLRICGFAPQTGKDGGKSPTHKMPSCPICQSLHLLGGGFTPPDAPLILLTLAFAGIVLAVARAFILKQRALPQAQPRAPPFSLA